MFSGFRNLSLQRPLDVETTGTDPITDRIVEAAAIRCEVDGRITRRRQLINPGVPIPPAATAVHGIADGEVADAPPFSELAPKLAAFVQDADLLGFNIRRFDLLILMAEFDRCGLRMSMAGQSIVDAYEIYVRQEPRHLSAAARRYLGAGPAERHASARTARSPTRRSSWTSARFLADGCAGPASTS